MTDDKMQPLVNDRPEQAKPELAGKQARQTPPSPAAQPSQPAAPGRKPLFGR